MAGHGRGAVIQNYQGKIMVVEHGVDQTGDSGVKESGVPDKRNNF